MICWPSHEDASLSPEGHRVLNIIPESFYHLSGTDWDREKQPFIERTIESLSKHAIPGLAEHVKVVECATPLDFERRLRLPEGAIYDLQQDLTSQTVFRPSARSKSNKGLLSGGEFDPSRGWGTFSGGFGIDSREPDRKIRIGSTKGSSPFVKGSTNGLDPFVEPY